MHRADEIEEEMPFELRGEMAVVADPDLCGGCEIEDDEEMPDTIPEPRLSSSDAEAEDDMLEHRMADDGMTPPSAA